MKILILNWRDPKNPKAGGAEVVTLEHAKAWVNAGHTVVWFAAHFPGCLDHEKIDGIEIVRKGSAAFGVQFSAFLWYISNQTKFDLVVDQIHGLPFFTPLYVRAKILVFIHEVTKEVWHLNPWPKPFNLIAATIGSLAEPWIFKLLYKNSRYMTVSQSTKKDLIEWDIPADNITVIHNGVRFPEKSLKFEKEKVKTIILLGALAADKGTYDAIQAFACLNEIKSDWQFWVVGHGDKKEIARLVEICKKLQIEAKVTFWGYVNNNKKFELLKKAHILLHPSIREGWGLVVIEAASQGTPAVVYDVPGLRDSVLQEKTGIIVNKNTPSEMANQTVRLLDDSVLYKKLQAQGVKWAQSLTWEKATRESLRLLQEIYEK